MNFICEFKKEMKLNPSSLFETNFSFDFMDM